MSSKEPLSVQINSNGVAEVRIQTMTMTPAFFNAIRDTFCALHSDTRVRCVVIYNGSEKGFTFGLDLKEAGAVLHGDGAADADAAAANEALFQRIGDIQTSFESIHHCQKPSIVVIHGHCIGGGVDLMLACDIRMAARCAKFSVKETQIAIVADLGTLQRIQRNVSRADCLRSRYHIIEVYSLPYTVNEVSRALRKQFEQHKDLTDVRRIDRLVFRGRQELEETNAIFKTKAHVMHYFETPNTQRFDTQGRKAIAMDTLKSGVSTFQPSPFLQEFFDHYKRDEAL